jgi:hypothetical protein
VDDSTLSTKGDQIFLTDVTQALSEIKHGDRALPSGFFRV